MHEEIFSAVKPLCSPWPPVPPADPPTMLSLICWIPEPNCLPPLLSLGIDVEGVMSKEPQNTDGFWLSVIGPLLYDVTIRVAHPYKAWLLSLSNS